MLCNSEEIGIHYKSSPGLEKEAWFPQKETRPERQERNFSKRKLFVFSSFLVVSSLLLLSVGDRFVSLQVEGRYIVLMIAREHRT
jgi:hypothetical protein